MGKAEVKVKLIHPGAVMPRRMSDGSAGYDLYAAEDVVVPPATTNDRRAVDIGRSLVPVGIIVELPVASVGRIGSRSGLSVDFNIEVGAGWIDSDYRGEILVELKNLSSKEYLIKQGDRIAQFIILSLVPTELKATESLHDSGRGSSGFGSTGVSGR